LVEYITLTRPFFVDDGEKLIGAGAQAR
jgi:hypothetical protein